MPQSAPAPCLHELRPGTKVCLHCRRAAREARAAHRNRIFVRITLTAMAIGVAAIGAKAGLNAWQRGSLPQLPILMAATTKALVESLPGAPAAAVATADSVAGPATRDSSATMLPVATDSTTATAPAVVAPPVVETVALTTPPPYVPPAPAALVPAVPEGRTELEGGMYAVRSGDTVTVYFDTPEGRTRRPDKFEQIVRATLPVTHGSAADALLASVAPGALVGAVDLVTDLPARGLHLRASDGRALSLWPETRPGRDGPLVVSYRTTLPR
jgi:hypothetical protein